MTQKELAEALGIDQSQVSRYAARGMPFDEDGARKWIEGHIRLTIKAPMFRRQARPMPVAAPPPKAWTVDELVELAQGIGAIMDDAAASPDTFSDGLPFLMSLLGHLARLSEAAVQRVRLPLRCCDAVHAWLDAAGEASDDGVRTT